MPDFRDTTEARRLLQAARAETDDGGFIDAGLVLDALDRADRGQPATAPAGYVIARDLGGGRMEGWETRTDGPDRGTTPMYPTGDEAAAQIWAGGASGEVWAVYALTEVQP